MPWLAESALLELWVRLWGVCLMAMDVACAIIERGGRVLAARRSRDMPRPGLWEFPGGKLAPGESAEQCLYREIREELGAEVKIRKRLLPCVHEDGKQPLRLIPFVCSISSGAPRALEHERIAWVPAGKLPSLQWCPADVLVLNQYLDSESQGIGSKNP